MGGSELEASATGLSTTLPCWGGDLVRFEEAEGAGYIVGG